MHRNRMKTFLVILATLILVALGMAAVVYGEADDSPGGQLVGTLLVVGAVWLAVRTVRAIQGTK